MSDWKTSCCILCSANCGIKVQLGGEDGREIIRIKGDDEHPGSKGYLCNKASRLNYYIAPQDRITVPQRRMANGDYEGVSWDTAINEIAAKFASIKAEFGGEKIFYYGGGGQANHAPGLYAGATSNALGVQYRSNALAQEKTGEFWVSQTMFGGWAHPDFAHCDLAIMVGKNPWQSHGFQRARLLLKEISRDPNRKMIVIDPKRTETADLADIHLQVKPARDAWLLAALAATIVQQDMFDTEFVDAYVHGHEDLFQSLSEINVHEFADICGISSDQIQQTAQLIADSQRVSVIEDLGIQMNRHSTLVSYLQRLLWITTGNFGRLGTNYLPNAIGPVGAGQLTGKSPVTGATIIGGLIPCNSVAEEILNDHPDRFRAMIVESSNPVHSLADSGAFRDAMRALDLSVVIDVAMTETAREADYVLPTANQYEKAEASFFTFEFPENYFHIRKPLFAAPDGLLSEAEIHSRIVEALGLVDDNVIETLDTALDQGMNAFQQKVFELAAKNPALAGIAPTILYRTLGRRLPEGMDNAAGFWLPVQNYANLNAEALTNAGITDQGEGLGNALFDELVRNPSAVVTSKQDWTVQMRRLADIGGINLSNPELLEEINQVLKAGAEEETSKEFPFLLAAGERRAFTANTIMRDPAWRRKDADGALLINPDDAARLNLGTGARALISTERGSANVLVEVSDRMASGFVSLPNGMGIDYPNEEDAPVQTGVSVNELTSLGLKDKFAGTPWHKSVPVRIEAI